MKHKIFSSKELLFLVTISLALGIRQMAMTIVMPFISTYSNTLAYSNATLAGVALGIFGLAQAIFQIPFGIWSDKIGNKRVILIGLMQVIIGLFIASIANNIYVLIFARALQGSGAILAAGYSWVIGDLDSKKRPRALSAIGIVISLGAASAFVLGPLIHNFLPIRLMFLVCAILILSVWFIILFFLNETSNRASHETLENQVKISDEIMMLLKNGKFLGFNLAGFFNNYVMSAVFYMIPIYLENITGINGIWKVFMPAVIIAIIYMKKSIIFVERGYGVNLTILSFTISAIGVCLYFNNQSFYFILAGSILFMMGYISLATVIPSLANDFVENSYRGVANGIINSFQYIGSFVGSVITGFIWGISRNVALLSIALVCICGIVTLIKSSSNFKVIHNIS